MESLDVKIKDALTTWNKLDEVDLKILEGLSLLGPRNLALIAEHLKQPPTTVRYRVKRMLSNSILFLHLNPYHTNMGLKKVVLLIEATQGHEEDLLECLKVNDFWIGLSRIYGPYEGYGGVWTIPKEKIEDFHSFLNSLLDAGVARSFETILSTCFQGVPIRSRWFSFEEGYWKFNWKEWVNEVETIEGELPYTLVEPEDWPILVDYEDLLIIKELEKNGRASLTDISKTLGISLEKIKYHFREHISKRGLIEGYQMEIYRFPFPLCEMLLFKFGFDDYDKMVKFALSMLDKPFAVFLGKVLGENALVSHIYLPKWEFRRFIRSLSILIKRGLLKQYYYVIQDMYQSWRRTIPYEHFENGRWNYDNEKHNEELRSIIEKMRNPGESECLFN